MGKKQCRYNVIQCTKDDLDDLYNDSALTFEGCADSDENFKFLTDWLNIHDCPMKSPNFYVISGDLMDDYYGLTGSNAYPRNGKCTIICIKLSDLTQPGNIILPRFEIHGRWFDDVVDNNLRREMREKST